MAKPLREIVPLIESVRKAQSERFAYNQRKTDVSNEINTRKWSSDNQRLKELNRIHKWPTIGSDKEWVSLRKSTLARGADKRSPVIRAIESGKKLRARWNEETENQNEGKDAYPYTLRRFDQNWSKKFRGALQSSDLEYTANDDMRAMTELPPAKIRNEKEYNKKRNIETMKAWKRKHPSPIRL